MASAKKFNIRTAKLPLDKYLLLVVFCRGHVIVVEVEVT